MPRAIHGPGWICFAIVLLFAEGCRPPAETTPKNLKEWFQQKMTNVNTEDGTIDVDSARDIGNDTIEYQTTKGGVRTTWRQRFRPTGSGQYERVGDPENTTTKTKAGGG